MSDPGGHGASSVPDEVWRRFAEDSEGAIRRSAPREPSARERAAGLRVTGESDAGHRAAGEPVRWVGESYDAPQGRRRTWRELSGWARLRYVGQVIVTAAVLTVLLLTVSRRPSEPEPGDGRPGDVMLREREDPADAAYVR